MKIVQSLDEKKCTNLLNFFNFECLLLIINIKKIDNHFCVILYGNAKDIQFERTI